VLIELAGSMGQARLERLGVAMTPERDGIPHSFLLALGKGFPRSGPSTDGVEGVAVRHDTLGSNRIA
jgi:hypothetical protein